MVVCGNPTMPHSKSLKSSFFLILMLDPGVSPEHMEPVYRGLGRCACAFWLAVAFDVVGLAVLLIGVFASVFFYDLLIYAGAIVIFLSLIWWVFWYSGNIEVPPAELEDDVGLLKKNKGGLSRFTGAVSRFSSRVSSGIRSSLRRNGGAPGGRTSKRSFFLYISTLQAKSLEATSSVCSQSLS
uniref:Si:dkeyp-72e1.6 n=1 Tax=Amphiprion percula TaxID=161767 RepID=A0A3P8SQK7_AMPPE